MVIQNLLHSVLFLPHFSFNKKKRERTVQKMTICESSFQFIGRVEIIESSIYADILVPCVFAREGYSDFPNNRARGNERGELEKKCYKSLTNFTNSHVVHLL